MTYFAIFNTDSDVVVEALTREQLEESLHDGSFGENPEFLQVVPNNRSKVNRYWGNQVLIIKGEVAPPEKIEVVTKWEVK